jgi:nucleoside-diphosphate-sugar epimerase
MNTEKPKILITGHTSGIGLALYNHFKNNYNCIGCSLSTGYDIANVEARKKIVKLTKDCVVFINNAYSDVFVDSQLDLLKAVYESCEDKNKIIINISSRITEFDNLNDPWLERYSESKLRQDQYCRGKQIINLKLGATDTPRVKWMAGDKIDTADVVKVVDFILSNYNSFKITTLTVGA